MPSDPRSLEERFLARDLPMGKVNFNGVRREVCLAYVPEACVGDFVVVHVGFAISVVDPAEAARMLAILDELGELDDDGVPEDSGEEAS